MTASMTIQQAIDAILAKAAVDPIANTADTFKTGDPQSPLRGVVTTFLATGAVITRAVELGANLIITHEPTWYTAEDDSEWLENDPTYQAKRRLIDENNIVIWRFHDYWHMTRPDGIMLGFVKRMGWTPDAPGLSSRQASQVREMSAGLGWNAEIAGAFATIATIEPTPLAELAQLLKRKLGANVARVTGPDDLVCRRVGLTLGALPGRMQIAALRRADVDAIITGETREWETCEYLRDAEFFGQPKGMIVVGHATSEEDGMAYLVDWLRPLLPDVPITHVPSNDPFRVF